MKILVGISGGVDSAYAARRLLDEGHEVEGCVLVMHEHTDVSAAASVAAELGIRLHQLDCTERFCSEIKTDFVNEYLNGRTPNPCIICNERVKFLMLFEYAMKNGFDRIATGHYARILGEMKDGKRLFYLCSSADESKDQTYMLYRLPQAVLEKTVFPLGSITKGTVREATAELGLSVSRAKDSQEICFLPNGDYADYIESVAGRSEPGSFVSELGDVLGEHKGIIRYTVGQRKGLGIALGKRMFVTAICPKDNTVVLGDKLRGVRSILISSPIYADPSVFENKGGRGLKVKLRYSATAVDVKADLLEDGNVLLSFAEEVKAAPGQSAVVYDGDRVVLGGFINSI